MQPLAARLRPQSLDEFIGQHEVIEILGKSISSSNIPSMIFWGPPGTGKTSLAEVIANSIDADFLRLSAVTDGKDSLKKVVKIAESNFQYNKKTILFIDEIHRWNKAQQDGLLPFVEKGVIVLIGATTENPSFSVISALLSRTRIIVFNEHSEKDIAAGIKKGLKLLEMKLDSDAKKILIRGGNGDMRASLNALELAAKNAQADERVLINLEDAKSAVTNYLRYDKNGEEHYNIISVIHKSLRGGNKDAAAYWISRMLNAGEDPLYIARRLIRFASEDIGNANPNALLLANVVYDTCQKIGMPECEVALIQLAEYLGDSPKNNSAYTAMSKVQKDIEEFGNLSVPMGMRNAPTKLMKELGYGKGYIYDHNFPDEKITQQALPDKLKNRKYFARSTTRKPSSKVS